MGAIVPTEELKDIVLCIPGGETRILTQDQTIVSWLFLLFLLRPLPSLISNCLNLPFGTQGRSRMLNEAYFLQTGNEHGKGLYLQGLHRVLLYFKSEIPEIWWLDRDFLIFTVGFFCVWGCLLKKQTLEESDSCFGRQGDKKGRLLLLQCAE